MSDRAQKLRHLSAEKRAQLLLALRQDAVATRAAEDIPRRPAGVRIPASFTQQRLWLLDQLAPGSAAYNLPCGIRLSGRLEVEVLRRSLEEVVRRHLILRTSVVTDGQGPTQVIAPMERLALPQVDLRRLDEARGGAEARRLLHSEARRSFHLARGPLLRVALVRLSEESWTLLLCLHHIVSDGWSNDIFSREVAALYQAFTAGLPSPLPELPIQYADFAIWQRQRLQGKTLERLLAHWRRRLRDAPPVLELPLDHPRPATPQRHGKMVSQALAAPTVAALRKLGQAREATSFMILLAAFQILLGRWSGSRRVVVGSPVTGRERPEVEGLIGFFANSLVLYNDLVGDPSFEEFLASVRRRVLEAQEHAELPFERLVEELRPERVEAINPLFQVVLVFKNSGHPGPVQLPGLTMEAVAPRELHSGTAKFDLTLFVDLDAVGEELALEYSSELWAETAGQRLLAQLQTLLESALERPTTKLSELPWLTSAARHQLLVEWRAPALASDAEVTVHSQFQARVVEAPESISVASSGLALSYRELDRRSEELAQTLQGRGLGAARMVGVAMERCPELVVSLVAVVKCGGAYVPLDPAYPKERLALMLADSGIHQLLTLECHLASLDQLPAGVARPLAVDRWMKHTRPAAPALVDTVSPDDLAYVVYTSGSTGRPKGVAVPHRAVVRLVRQADYVDLGTGEVVMQFAPPAFDASTLEIWGALLRGARLGLMPPGALSLAELGTAIFDLRITTAWLTAGLFHQMVDAEASSLRMLRQLVAGGDVLSVPHCQRFLQAVPSCRLINGYGPTENTTFTCCHPMTAGAPVHAPVPIGRPIVGTRVYVLGPGLRPVAIGVPGELCAGGDGVAQGYRGQAALTAERFVPELWGPQSGGRMYRTGDRARYLRDGSVEFLGRGDHQVKVRGFRIEPEEIETVLSEQPEVLRAAVVVSAAVAAGLSTVEGDKRLVAFIVPQSGPSADSSTLFLDLRKALGERLPSYMVPTHWQSLADLPLNANGKVDRSALAREAADVLRSAGQQPGRALLGDLLTHDPALEMLVGLWIEVLGVRPTSPDDDFFDLGGHSLLATQIVARVRESFGVNLPLATLFEHSTVGEMAGEIAALRRQDRGVEVSPLLPAPRQGRLALSFAQERLWVLDRFEPGSSAFNISTSVLLRGALEVGVLERALAVVIDRHEILRTTFGVEEGEPFQHVRESLTLPLPLVDLRALEPGDRKRWVSHWGQEVAATSFDLAAGPLLRLVLLATAANEHALLLAIHHIVSDGWSIGLLVEELATAYAALAQGRAPELPPLAVQYADFSAWQRQQKGLLDSQLDYWRERLATVSPAFDLPTDHPRSGVRTYRGESVHLRLEAPLSAQLNALARERGTTLFMVLLATLEILLGRLSGENDVVVGAPVAGRGTLGVERLMGVFLNTLVLRTNLSGRPSFVELLGRVRETALGAYDHQEVPFEKLLEELRPERDLSRTPFFQVFFNMLNLPKPVLELPGLTIEPLSSPSIPAKFDLTVYAEEKGEEIHFDLVYNRDLFRPERMAEMARQLHGLLAQVVESREQSIDHLSLLTPTSRALFPDLQSPLGDEWLGAVHQLFARRARRLPDRPAVLAGELTWTYGELEGLANRVAGRLSAEGVGHGDVVAIYGRRDPRLVLAVLGVMKAGAAFVILDPAYPAERLIECLRLAQPVAWIEMPVLKQGSAASPGATAWSAAEVLPEPLVRFFEASPLRSWVVLPALSSDGGFLAGWPERDPQVEVGPESLAYIAFTSGSTGTPKGILGRHGPLSHFIPWQVEEFGLGEADRFSMLSGIAHDPLQRDLFTPLQVGAAICVPEPSFMAEPGRLAEWMRSAGITIAHLTPAMGQVLTEAVADRAALRLKKLRFAFLVGDILTWRDVARLRELAPEISCVNYFGSTETQRAVGYATIPPVRNNLKDGVRDTSTVHGFGRAEVQTGASKKAVLSLGRGVRNVQLLVLNKAGALAGSGEVGEIYVRSPHLARGYLADPGRTAERFLPAVGNGFGQRVYRTGDLGRYLPHGEVEFAGRADHQIKVRGFRIEPGEIERLMDSHPAVQNSVVLARSVAGREKKLVAYVAAEGRLEVTKELRVLLKRRLPDYMVPAAFVLLPKLPLNPNGKIDRAALGRLDPSESRDQQGLGGGSYVAPRTEVERMIAAVLREALGVEEVGLKDSFFELGGDSLMMVRVQSRLSEIFGREIQMVQLFTHPTVAELARWLGDGEGRPAKTHLKADRSDELRLGKSRRQLRFDKMKGRKRQDSPTKPGDLGRSPRTPETNSEDGA